MIAQDKKYMELALKLARRGIGSVEPNPAVGAVIVKSNQIIGRGWHKKFGGPHAEINALEDCKNLGVDPCGAEMYVTLEPCCHQGKTGPCTKAIIEAGLAKVFVASIDPSEHAKGAGVEQLRNAGIEVQTGICETEAKLLNGPFIKFAATGKCWVTLKWAQSIDGKLAWAQQNEERRWISNELSRKDAHKLRRRVGSILVGINTVLADNPLLTARPSKGKKAIRIVLDSYLRIPPDCQLLETAKKCPVLIYTNENAVKANLQVAEKITQKGVEILTYPQTEGRSNLYFLIDELSKRGIGHLLVEGGPAVLTSFLKESLADEIVVYLAPSILGSTGSAEITSAMAELTKAISLHHVETECFGDDVRLGGLTEKAIKELSIVER
jgi:diaminohydroxyphosphoribosylaminopyrimidine deaminase/5-amino-6-(5-phosphoribosylamino)uracil reductase